MTEIPQTPDLTITPAYKEGLDTHPILSASLSLLIDVLHAINGALECRTVKTSL